MGRRLLVFTDWWRGNLNYIKYLRAILPFLCKIQAKLVEEFYQKRPQLHVPLAWMKSDGGKSSIHVFDGQHKAAAQIMLGVKSLPVRVFIDPHPDILIKTNTNAGTTLKQVAFDKSVQRHLGNSLYQDRIQRYRKETGRVEDDLSFSERDLVTFFKGQSKEALNEKHRDGR
jgi:hypothetical protein